MSKRSKLNPEEAKEYSKSLGKGVTSNYELMDFAIHVLRVPEALGISPQEWVEQIGGYVKMSVEERRKAVDDLTERGMTTSQIAVILGISSTTVRQDQEHAEELARVDAQKRAQIEAQQRVDEEEKQTAKQKAAKLKSTIERLLGEGKSNGEIAALVGMSATTIRLHYRKPWMETQKSPGQKAAEKIKGNEVNAKIEEVKTAIGKAVTDATYGDTLSASLEVVTEQMSYLLEMDTEITDYEAALALWAKVGNDLWVYGAKRGFDVSSIATMMDRLRGET